MQAGFLKKEQDLSMLVLLTTETKHAVFVTTVTMSKDKTDGCITCRELVEFPGEYFYTCQSNAWMDETMMHGSTWWFYHEEIDPITRMVVQWIIGTHNMMSEETVFHTSTKKITNRIKIECQNKLFTRHFYTLQLLKVNTARD